MEGSAKPEEKPDPRLENLIPFTTENQPSPKAKSLGWRLRQAREAIAAAFIKFSLMTVEDIAKIKAKVDNGDFTDLDGNLLTVAEAKAISYIGDKKHDVDFMNRGLAYVEQKIDVTSNGESVNFGLSELIKEARNGKQQAEIEAKPA